MKGKYPLMTRNIFAVFFERPHTGGLIKNGLDKVYDGCKQFKQLGHIPPSTLVGHCYYLLAVLSRRCAVLSKLACAARPAWEENSVWGRSPYGSMPSERKVRYDKILRICPIGNLWRVSGNLEGGHRV
jgi:hypothetical protein